MQTEHIKESLYLNRHHLISKRKSGLKYFALTLQFKKGNYGKNSISHKSKKCSLLSMFTPMLTSLSRVIFHRVPELVTYELF